MQRTQVEIGPVSVSISRLVDAVWEGVQSQSVADAEFSGRMADLLDQAADVVRLRLGLLGVVKVEKGV